MSTSRARVAATPRAGHEHSWALCAVTHEDGHVVEEYDCPGCGDRTFR